MLVAGAGSERNRSRVEQRYASGRAVPPLQPEIGRAAALLHPLVSPWPSSIRQGKILFLTLLSHVFSVLGVEILRVILWSVKLFLDDLAAGF